MTGKAQQSRRCWVRRQQAADRRPDDGMSAQKQVPPSKTNHPRRSLAHALVPAFSPFVNAENAVCRLSRCARRCPASSPWPAPLAFLAGANVRSPPCGKQVPARLFGHFLASDKSLSTRIKEGIPRSAGSPNSCSSEKDLLPRRHPQPLSALLALAVPRRTPTGIPHLPHGCRSIRWAGTTIQ
jgi:hypothetical protein